MKKTKTRGKKEADMTILNAFDIAMLGTMDQVFTDKEGKITTGAGWKPNFPGQSIGIHDYHTNELNDGTKQGLDLRDLSSIYAVGVTTGKITPVATTGSAFGQGVRVEGCGDTWMREVFINNELPMANDVNADGFNENGNSIGDGGENSILRGVNWVILNPGETGFDCKKGRFELHKGLVAGALENCAKFWRDKDGTFSEWTFDLRGSDAGGKFIRLPSAGAIIKFWNCQFIDQAGNITSMPPDALVTVDSGASPSLQLIELTAPPAYLSTPYFLAADPFLSDPPAPPPPPPPSGDPTNQDVLDAIAGIDLRLIDVGNNAAMLGASVAMVSAKVDGVGIEVFAVGAKVDAVGVKVDVVGAKVDAVGAKVDSLGVDVSVVGAKVDSVGVKVDGVDANVTSVGAKVSNIALTNTGS